MHNRIGKFWNKKTQSPQDVKEFFLACEFKPYSSLWYLLESLAYNIAPAFIHGKLGILSYDPASYAIVQINAEDEPLMGYIMTITNPDGIFLLDKLKGYNGSNAFNSHMRLLSSVFINKNTSTMAWCYVATQSVLDVYKQIEQIEWGMWEKDENQLELLEKITDPED